jgi:hypothetical protein
MSIRLPLLSVLLMVSLAACRDNVGNEDGNDGSAVEAPDLPNVQAPQFNADSAYAYVAKQVAFGPRVPGTKAQEQCAAWMAAELRRHCDTVFIQRTSVKGGDGSQQRCINLIGAINPAATRRVLLLAHWDSRPWADRDVKDTDKPVDGADDGASGVGVLLEMARMIKTKPLPAGFGIDILFTDVEDYGKEEWGEDSYGLGTQYWSANPHVPGYRAAYGILLDMVGGRGARFPREDFSTQYAPDVQQRLWQTANRVGYSAYFPFDAGGAITDDHVFVNRIARIPTIDVIHLTSTGTGFPAHWHTHADNMSVIDRATLKAVGQSVLQMLYEEQSI